MSASFRQWGIILVILCGCSQFQVEPTPAAKVTALPVQQVTQLLTPTSIPTVEATPEEAQSLTLWIPDVLMPTTSGEGVTDILNEQIAAFATSENGVPVEVRRKRVRDAGGILQTLRSARDVAPSVVPDLTLMRREDLLSAAQASAILPLEGIVPTAMIGNLYPAALKLGQHDGQLYGLPYSLEVEHIIYNADEVTTLSPRFSSYLQDATALLFPAQRDNSLSTVFLVQYMAAGGAISDTGSLELNETALLETLTFYEEAVARGLITDEVLDYARALEYRPLLASGDYTTAVVGSQLYLELVNESGEIPVGLIPTSSGEALTGLDSWMWVMSTTDPSRQAVVADFLDWMMETERQARYIRSLYMIPSQQSAVRQAYDGEYLAFISELLANPNLPATNAANGAVARALQTAFVSVISGEQTAKEATQSVVDQVSS
jgi:ABC-type glycerol-3-phosphate transport system substrate-binding protein